MTPATCSGTERGKDGQYVPTQRVRQGSNTSEVCENLGSVLQYQRAYRRDMFKVGYMHDQSLGRIWKTRRRDITCTRATYRLDEVNDAAEEEDSRSPSQGPTLSDENALRLRLLVASMPQVNHLNQLYRQHRPLWINYRRHW